MMDNSNLKHNFKDKEHRLADAASELIHESKKYASDLYEEGVDKLTDAQETAKQKLCDAHDTAKQYSDELLLHVQKNPLKSVLIAAGVGFVVSALIRK